MARKERGRNMSSMLELADLARRLRLDSVRMLARAGSGHLGGCLSAADIMAVLYGERLRVRPEEPEWDGRDRFVLSIGHIAPVYYAALAERGFFPLEELLTLRELGSRLQGHPARSHSLPGVDTASGSLGQGLSVAVGFALAARLQEKEYHTYALLGDGELQEGQVWEAAMSASFYGLDHLTVLIDRNRVQIDGQNRQVMEVEPLAEKWQAFGWGCIATEGHKVPSLLSAFAQRDAVKKPCAIICETEMGQGVASIAGDYRWHGKAPSEEQAAQFEKEIEDYSLDMQHHLEAVERGRW